jgi:hypothetical protein
MWASTQTLSFLLVPDCRHGIAVRPSASTTPTSVPRLTGVVPSDEGMDTQTFGHILFGGAVEDPDNMDVWRKYLRCLRGMRTELCFAYHGL